MSVQFWCHVKVGAHLIRLLRCHNPLRHWLDISDDERMLPFQRRFRWWSCVVVVSVVEAPSFVEPPPRAVASVEGMIVVWIIIVLSRRARSTESATNLFVDVVKAITHTWAPIPFHQGTHANF